MRNRFLLLALLLLGACHPAHAQYQGLTQATTAGLSQTAPSPTPNFITNLISTPSPFKYPSMLNAQTKPAIGMMDWFSNRPSMFRTTGMPTTTLPADSAMPALPYLQQFGYRVPARAQ